MLQYSVLMPDDDVCDVCGEEDCPCSTCHGDPKHYIGAFHTSGENEDGTVECFVCGEVSGP